MSWIFSARFDFLSQKAGWSPYRRVVALFISLLVEMVAIVYIWVSASVSHKSLPKISKVETHPRTSKLNKNVPFVAMVHPIISLYRPSLHGESGRSVHY